MPASVGMGLGSGSFSFGLTHLFRSLLTGLSRDRLDVDNEERSAGIKFQDYSSIYLKEKHMFSYCIPSLYRHPAAENTEDSRHQIPASLLANRSSALSKIGRFLCEHKMEIGLLFVVIGIALIPLTGGASLASLIPGFAIPTSVGIGVGSGLCGVGLGLHSLSLLQLLNPGNINDQSISQHLITDKESVHDDMVRNNVDRHPNQPEQSSHNHQNLKK